MKNKYLKLLISICVIVCVIFSSAVMCFAETEPATEEIPPLVVETEIEVTDEPEKPSVEVRPVEPQTNAPVSVAPATSQAVTRPTTQRRPATNTTTRRPSNQSANNNNNGNNNNNPTKQSTTTTKPATTLPELPEGAGAGLDGAGADTDAGYAGRQIPYTVELEIP